MRYFLHHGHDRVSFDSPQGWELFTDALPLEVSEPTTSISQRTKEAMAQCIGETRLEDTLTPEKRVVILTDDNARPTPVREMLPVLMKRLLTGGISKEDIDIVVGSGTHAPLGEQELLQKFGEEVIQDYRVNQHNCMAEDLVPIGRLKTGCEIRIHPIAADADVLIGVGGILPHPMSGFGGGPKILFPGIANYEAIREHHLAQTVQPGSIFGNLAGNPFYEEIYKIAQKAGLTYCLNCVFDKYDRVAHILFGSFEAVHEKGTTLAKQQCGMAFPDRSDITMISAYPYLEPLQIIKPLITASLVTKTGGTIILVAKTNRPMPTSFVETFEEILKSSQGKLREHAVTTFKSKSLLVENAPVDFNCALFFALLCRNDHRIVLVSEELTPDSVERMGFVHYHQLKEAIEKERQLTPSASVNLIPIGGALPMLHERTGGNLKP